MIHQSDTPRTDEAVKDIVMSKFISVTDCLEAREKALMDIARQLERENAKLQRWKSEQLAVESTWDAQTVGKLLGVKLGQPIRPEIQPAIEAMFKVLKEAHRHFAQSLRQWASHYDMNNEERLQHENHLEAALFKQAQEALGDLSIFLK